MKFRYILGVALSALMFVSCASDNDPLGALDNIQKYDGNSIKGGK